MDGGQRIPILNQGRRLNSSGEGRFERSEAHQKVRSASRQHLSVGFAPLNPPYPSHESLSSRCFYLGLPGIPGFRSSGSTASSRSAARPVPTSSGKSGQGPRRPEGLHFDHPASRPSSQGQEFKVTIAADVPPGTHEVRASAASASAASTQNSLPVKVEPNDARRRSRRGQRSSTARATATATTLQVALRRTSHRRRLHGIRLDSTILA